MAEDLLSRIGAEIDARMRDLRSLVDEYEQMLAAAGALESKGAGAQSAARSRGKRRAPAARPGGKRRAPAAKASTSPAAKASVSPATRARTRAPRERSVRGAAQQAILAALEHGSHTVSELVVVTAMSAPTVRENLRRLLKAGTVARASRDGKAAYALSR
jgi:DNA-binding transcriptional ArsR family regulator